jgi:hypothetical protein
VALDDAAHEYLEALAARLTQALGPPLRGLYTTGSAAIGAYAPGRSDLDALAVVGQPLNDDQRQRAAHACDHVSILCPARKLELVLMTADQAGSPHRDQSVELNVNTGAHLGLRTPAVGWHWLVIDVAVARKHGARLAGPPPERLLGPVDRKLALLALAETVAWYVREQLGREAVIAACRAWRYADTGDWSGKDDALRWAGLSPIPPS